MNVIKNVFCWKMIILKAVKGNFIVFFLLFVLWYISPNFYKPCKSILYPSVPLVNLFGSNKTFVTHIFNCFCNTLPQPTLWIDWLIQQNSQQLLSKSMLHGKNKLKNFFLTKMSPQNIVFHFVHIDSTCLNLDKPNKLGSKTNMCICCQISKCFIKYEVLKIINSRY